MADSVAVVHASATSALAQSGGDAGPNSIALRPGCELSISGWSIPFQLLNRRRPRWRKEEPERGGKGTGAIYEGGLGDPGEGGEGVTCF